MVVGSDHRAHRTGVSTGVTQGNDAQITRGLTAGQTVVTVGGYGLPDNTQVKVAERQPPNRGPASAEKD
jgi:hypothetical protein